MKMFHRSYGRVSLGLGLAIAVAMSPVSASAGFLDQLFGGGSAPPPQPYYAPEAPQQPMMPDSDSQRPAPRKKRVVAREATPVRQKTTDLMHDKTLRPGDAIMMKDGMHVYNGPETAKHSPNQFVPIDDAQHVPSSTRAALVAVDTTRNDPLASGGKPETLISGRSAAIGTPIVKGFKITDARGASVRYVGP